MNRQKSFENEEGAALYLIPTPVGNLSEISPRQKALLEAADVIACEDTRNSGQLLKTLGISKPLIAHHQHNSASSTQGILRLFEQGKKAALISDAGYPLISDPGNQLVRAAIDQNVPVITCSGSNAALIALVASGLPSDHYLFYGFLDHKSTRRKKELETLKTLPYTLIFYEAPHRIEAMLGDCLEVFGNRRACLGRELTKLHEEYLRGTLEEILEASPALKGEMAVVIEGAVQEASMTLEEAARQAVSLAHDGMKAKEAARELSEKSGFSKNEIYKAMLSLDQQ